MTVTLHREPGPPDILVITLDRPRAANAIDGAVSAGFCDALRTAAADPSIGAAIVTGRGERVFSAGADLKNPDDLPASALAQHRADGLAAMLRAVLDFPKPLVASVNGVAAGAGAMIAWLADRVIVAASARFVLPEIDVGMPTLLGLAILSDLGGSALAADLVLSGRSLPAEEAAQRGLAVCVHPAELARSSLAAARMLAAKDATAFARNKAWLMDVGRIAIERALRQRHADPAQGG